MSDEPNTTVSPATISPPSEIKVAVIEDHREFREYLAALLNGADGFRCVGSYRSMEEAAPKISAAAPDIALIDIGLPGMSGIEGIRLLKEQRPKTLLITLTVHDEDERIFDALCAGASGYLLKKTPPTRLLESLKEAIAGGSPMSPEVARRVIEMFHKIRPPEHVDYQLTPHELRILKLFASGHNYKTAADEIGVTPSTISFHLQKIYEKLQVHSKTEAVAKALRDRLI
ncbi:MAG TPA: response regulator transcription factor [Blastocatellia bacterium]|nr:response regulator transcription factor [Blastocatellia bacterium]